jgi:hypothetical protein
LRRFEEIHDFIYAHDGLSPQEILEEFIKILFIKIFKEGDIITAVAGNSVGTIKHATAKEFCY